MHLSGHWQIVAANGTVLLWYLLIKRWHRKLSIGYLGLALIILPIAFEYFSGRLHFLEFAGPLLGILLLVADFTGKLPRKGKDSVQRK